MKKELAKEKNNIQDASSSIPVRKYEEDILRILEESSDNIDK